jgi:Flp pilus assembly pilin Flp
MVVKKGGERTMELLKRLVVEEEGQGLVEYTLIVLLVALVFWVAVKGTNADQALTNAWTDIVNCLNSGVGAGCTGS